MYSIIFTVAIFIAVLLNDVIQHRTQRVPLHSFLGSIVIGLLTVLWYLDFEIVGWALIMIPIVALLISYIVVATRKTSMSATTVSSGPVGVTQPSGSVASNAGACIQNPGGPYTAVAQPMPPSTVSLPAAAAATIVPAVMPANTPPAMKITPLSDEC
jgi:predicted lipid-binding transport protein (Tim44 family)